MHSVPGCPGVGLALVPIFSGGTHSLLPCSVTFTPCHFFSLSLPFSHVLNSSSNPLVELSIHARPPLSAELRTPGEQGLYTEPLTHVLTYSRCSVKPPGAL